MRVCSTQLNPSDHEVKCSRKKTHPPRFSGMFSCAFFALSEPSSPPGGGGVAGPAVGVADCFGLRDGMEVVDPEARMWYMPNKRRSTRVRVAGLAFEAGSRQQPAGSGQQAAGSMQQAAGSRQHAAGSRQQAAGSRQQAARSRQEAAG